MLFSPTSQSVTIDRAQNLIRQKTPCKEKMTKSFSTSHGVFCLTYLQKGQRCSLWSGNIEKLLLLFFTIKNVSNKELIFFPTDSDEVITIFRGIK